MLTGSQDRQGAMLLQPLHGGLVEFVHAGGGHGPVEGLKKRLEDDAKLERNGSRLSLLGDEFAAGKWATKLQEMTTQT